MPREYDDERYLEWCAEMRNLIIEFLDTDGNTEQSLRDEIETAIENAKDG